MRRMSITLLLGFTVSPCIPAHAQAGSNWDRVKQVQPGTALRISSQHRPAVCQFVSADEDALICTQTRSFFFVPVTQRLLFPRREIVAIKLSRHFLSGVAGLAIGSAAGAGIGAAVDGSSKSKEDGHGVTALGALLGAGAGAAIGSKADFLAGPTIYRNP